MRLQQLITLLLTGTALTALPETTPVWAQEVGTATAVNPQTQSTAPGGKTVTLNVGARVVHRERIQTSSAGTVQLLFLDKSTLSIAPNTSLLIDDYVYNPNDRSGHMVASLAKGALRFVGGQLSHEGQVKISTPSVTLGIRGGTAIVQHNAKGTYVANLYEVVTAANHHPCGTQKLWVPGFKFTFVDPYSCREPGRARDRRRDRILHPAVYEPAVAERERAGTDQRVADRFRHRVIAGLHRSEHATAAEQSGRVRRIPADHPGDPARDGAQSTSVASAATSAAASAALAAASAAATAASTAASTAAASTAAASTTAASTAATSSTSTAAAAAEWVIENEEASRPMPSEHKKAKSSTSPLTAYLIDGHHVEIRPAPVDREWMDQTNLRFAYRCLPLSIANAYGWELLVASGFVATWNGKDDLAAITVVPDAGSSAPAISHFGHGILTFYVPCLFRTAPGFDLMVQGPVNSPKDAIGPLAGVVETDWCALLVHDELVVHASALPGSVRKGRAVLSRLSGSAQRHRGGRT